MFDLIGFRGCDRGVVHVCPHLARFAMLCRCFRYRHHILTAVTTAAGRDDLLRTGWLLLLVSILHNAAGLILGY
jgi:hypothetical protein